jgi:hypothetical protein
MVFPFINGTLRRSVDEDEPCAGEVFPTGQQTLDTSEVIVDMEKAYTICAAAVFATLCGCASEPLPTETLQSVAIRAAQKRGAADLGCPAASAQILSKETLPETQGSRWFDPPRKAAYTVAVSGCGKSTEYSLTCDDNRCVPGPAAVGPSPEQLAGDLQPGAISAAQQTGRSDLSCEAVTTEVLRQETIQEVQRTGSHEPPHKTAYTIDVTGCGTHTTYLVSCDGRQKNCVTGTFRKKAEGGPPQLADKLQPDAERVAQQQGAADLECPAATIEVLRQATIEEVQTTGWYEPPHHAAYSVAVSGCGKRATYAVACDDREERVCLAGGVHH